METFWSAALLSHHKRNEAHMNHLLEDHTMKRTLLTTTTLAALIAAPAFADIKTHVVVNSSESELEKMPTYES